MNLINRVKRVEEACKRLERFLEAHETLLEGNPLDDLEYILSLLEEAIE